MYFISHVLDCRDQLIWLESIGESFCRIFLGDLGKDTFPFDPINTDFLITDGAKPSVKTGIMKNNEYSYAT